MDAEKIVRLSTEIIVEMLESRRVNVIDKDRSSETRRAERWPFPGTVEVWLPEGCYGEGHLLATMHNLSLDGLAMRARRPIPIGTKVQIAMHQPEMTCYGNAIVRHCTAASIGYLVGVEFCAEDDEK